MRRSDEASQAKPSQAKPGQAKPGHAKPNQTKPGQAKPSQANPSQAKPKWEVYKCTPNFSPKQRLEFNSLQRKQTKLVVSEEHCESPRKINHFLTLTMSSDAKVGTDVVDR